MTSKSPWAQGQAPKIENDLEKLKMDAMGIVLSIKDPNPHRMTAILAIALGFSLDVLDEMYEGQEEVIEDFFRLARSFIGLRRPHD